MLKSTKGLFERQRQVVIITHSHDPVTSLAAAEKVVESGTQNKWWVKILDVLSLRPDYSPEAIGWSSKEIASELSGGNWHAAYYEVSKRMRELVNRGDVVIADSRFSKVGDTGTEVQVFRKAAK
jgi:hypothetical protein